jgi:hypothetical protein
MSTRFRRVAAAFALALCALSAYATGIHVPPGASFEANGGRIDFAGGSFLVDGHAGLGDGELAGLDALRIGATGIADFGSGTATLFGDFENRGTFNAGTSRVQLRDGVAAQSAILGPSQFANLSLVSANGKRYRFESGQTQRIAGSLQITGNGAPIQIDVTTSGQLAYVNLLPGGTQAISNVGVSDVHATGQHLAPTQTNQGGNGNDNGWFGGGPLEPPRPIPAVSPFLLAALAALLAFVGLRRRDAAWS